jgi:hypothetical protein
MRKSCSSEVLVESLEGRRLFSMISLAPMLAHAARDVHMASFAVAQQTALSTAVANKTVLAPDLRGTWVGTIKVDIMFLNKRVPFTLHITDQTATTVTGEITVDGHSSGTGSFDVVFGKRNQFTLTYSGNDVSGTLSGFTNNLDMASVGTFAGEGYGFHLNGTFDAARTELPGAA